MNKKQVVRINENQLKQIITESVKRVIKENEYDDIDGKIKVVQSYINAKETIEQLENYVWEYWDEYEEHLGEPMWPMDDKGNLEGAKRLLRVLKSIKGEDDYLDKYGDWTLGGERDTADYMRNDGKTWGKHYRDNLDKSIKFNR